MTERGPALRARVAAAAGLSRTATARCCSSVLRSLARTRRARAWQVAAGGAPGSALSEGRRRLVAARRRPGRWRDLRGRARGHVRDGRGRRARVCMSERRCLAGERHARTLGLGRSWQFVPLACATGRALSAAGCCSASSPAWASSLAAPDPRSNPNARVPWSPQRRPRPPRLSTFPCSKTPRPARKMKATKLRES